MGGVGGGGHEITLTINNSSLTQALAQAQAQQQGQAVGPANTQEITLTISGKRTWQPVPRIQDGGRRSR